MVDMIATKGLRYGTRRLMAGDPFEARHDRDARLLVGIGKARYATRHMVAADERPAPAPAADDRPALRAEYEAKFGKKAFPGWSSDVLRQKLAAG